MMMHAGHSQRCVRAVEAVAGAAWHWLFDAQDAPCFRCAERAAERGANVGYSAGLRIPVIRDVDRHRELVEVLRVARDDADGRLRAGAQFDAGLFAAIQQVDEDVRV